MSSSEQRASARAGVVSRKAGRRMGVAVLVAAAWAAVAGAAGVARAEIIYSNYGPDLSYNHDRTTAPADGGALWLWSGPSYNTWALRTEYFMASFTTPDHEFLVTKAVLPVHTWYDCLVFIFRDVNGRPESDSVYQATEVALTDVSVINPINSHLYGRTEFDGNAEVPMVQFSGSYAPDNTFVPTPLLANTRYWFAFVQLQQQYDLGPDSERGWTQWYRTTDTTPTAENSLYHVGYFSDKLEYAEFYNGVSSPAPAFQIEGTRVVPEPTGIVAASLFTLAATARRRRRVCR